MLIGSSGTAAITKGSGTTLYDLVKGDAGGATGIDGFQVGTNKIALSGCIASDATIASSGGSVKAKSAP